MTDHPAESAHQGPDHSAPYPVSRLAPAFGATVNKYFACVTASRETFRLTAAAPLLHPEGRARVIGSALSRTAQPREGE